MHQKKPSRTHIRREPREGGNSRSRGISSSSCGVYSPVIYQKHSPKPQQQQQQQQQQQPNFLTRNQPQPQRRTQTQAHVQIQIQIPPPSPPNPPLPVPSPLLLTHQQQPHSNLHHKRIQKPILSSPHKRPSIMTMMMNQSHSSLSHSPTLSSLHFNHHHKQPNFDKKSILNSTIPFAIRTVAHRVFCHLRRARLLCVHLRVLILISLPSLYFFFSNPFHFFILNLVFILVFSITILISLNLSIPRLPSIRLLLARSLPKKFSSARLAKKEGKPVVWSIGSKPKSEKKLKSGSWVQVYSNGDVYEGEFHKGKCSGSGVYYYCMSGRYEGDWVDEKYDGFGVETWAKGSRYRGQYRQGLRHGIGVYRFYTGDVYAGEWANGQCHGCGIHTCEDGSRYGGEFKWGVKHGLGHYHFRNGDRYAGEYFGDKMHGFGVYQFGNGHRYEGAWHEGRRQGLGMYTFRNGETQSGHWQNGVLDIPTTGSSRPGPFAVNHSKVLNAVQEARRAAEKAYSVVKVDDRVNKAVAAANKAANAARVVAVKAVQNHVHHGNGDDIATPFV